MIMNHISSDENRKRKNPKEVKILKHSNKQKDYKHHQNTTCNQLNLHKENYQTKIIALTGK